MSCPLSDLIEYRKSQPQCDGSALNSNLTLCTTHSPLTVLSTHRVCVLWNSSVLLLVHVSLCLWSTFHIHCFIIKFFFSILLCLFSQVKLWNTSTGLCFVTFAEHSAAVTSVVFNPAGKVVLSSSLDGTVRAHDLHR